MQTGSLFSYIQHKAKINGENTVSFIPKVEMGFHYSAELWNNYLRKLTEQVAVTIFLKIKLAITIMLGVDLIQKVFDRCVENMPSDRAHRGFSEKKT